MRWNHTRFAVTINGISWHPYLAAEGKWRATEDSGEPGRMRFSTDTLDELVMKLATIS